MTGHCTYFYDVNCSKWQSTCHSCPKLRLYPKSIFWDNSTNNHKKKIKAFSSLENLTIVPVSKWVESLVVQSYFSNRSIKTIYNGVDTEIFYPVKNVGALREKHGLEGKFILLGLATTWGKRKGWYDYLKLCDLLPEDYVIVLVGLNDQQLKGLPKKIIGIKRTESIEELVEYYSMADIVLNISYQETFGLTTIEGFACGTPGIVYNCTASPELISEKTGIIIEPGNMDQLIKAILEIREKGKDYYSKSCRERALNLFNAKDRFNDYVDLYESLCK